MKNADNCRPEDCIRDPVTAGCEEYCTFILMESATPLEKILILGLRYETAMAIFSIFNNRRNNIRRFSELASELSYDQVEEIRERFRQTTPDQRAYFQLGYSERENVIRALERLWRGPRIQ